MGAASASAGLLLSGGSSRPRRKAPADGVAGGSAATETGGARPMARFVGGASRRFERGRGSLRPSAILPRPHAQDEAPFGGEEALKGDRGRKGKGPPRLHEPHARAQERQA